MPAFLAQCLSNYNHQPISELCQGGFCFLKINYKISTCIQAVKVLFPEMCVFVWVYVYDTHNFTGSQCKMNFMLWFGSCRSAPCLPSFQLAHQLHSWSLSSHTELLEVS